MKKNKLLIILLILAIIAAAAIAMYFGAGNQLQGYLQFYPTNQSSTAMTKETGNFSVPGAAPASGISGGVMGGGGGATQSPTP